MVANLQDNTKNKSRGCCNAVEVLFLVYVHHDTQSFITAMIMMFQRVVLHLV